MSAKKLKQLRRQLRAAGLPALAPRVQRRLLRAYAAVPRRERPDFDVTGAAQRVSREAFAAMWGRMSDEERRKFMARATP